MKVYDYKDESRDVKGKVRGSSTNSISADWKTQRDLRATTDAPGLKERRESYHS